jgi:hypothetical protein
MKIGLITQSILNAGKLNLKDFSFPDCDSISILNLRFYNPSNFNIKINGLLIPPKGTYEMDLSADFIQNQYTALGGLYPFFFEPMNVIFPNGKGSLDISVSFLFQPRTILA